MIGQSVLGVWMSLSSTWSSSGWLSSGWSAATPAPKAPNADSVTPGVWGFVITFLVAAVTVLLIIDMTRRIRRTRYRAEIAEKLDAEAAESEAHKSGDDSTGG